MKNSSTLRKIAKSLLMIISFSCLFLRCDIQAEASDTFNVTISSYQGAGTATEIDASASMYFYIRVVKNDGSPINCDLKITEGGTVVYQTTTSERTINISANTFSPGKSYVAQLTANNGKETCQYSLSFSTKAAGNPYTLDSVTRAGRYDEGSPISTNATVYGNGNILSRVYVEYSGTGSGIIYDSYPNSETFQVVAQYEGLPAGNYTFYLKVNYSGRTGVVLASRDVEIYAPERPEPPSDFSVSVYGDASEFDADATIITSWTKSENVSTYYVTLYNSTKGTTLFSNVDCGHDRTYTISNSYLESNCNYSFVVRAVNEGGEKTSSVSFYVKNKVIYTPSYRGSGLNSEYRIGDTVSLSGTIYGNGGTLESVSVYMIDGSGNRSRICSTSPNVTDFSAYQVLKFVAGDTVIDSVGSYSFEIYAKTVGGEDTLIYSTSISVKRKDTWPGDFSIKSPTYNAEFETGGYINVSWTESANAGYYVVILQNQFKKEIRSEYNVGNSLSYSIYVSNFFEPDWSYTLYVIAHDEHPEDDDINTAQTQIIITPTSDDIANTTFEKIQIKYQSGDSADSVTGNIALPSVVNAQQITWSSSDEKYLTNTGFVKRPEVGDQTVRLTASINVHGERYTQKYYFVIKGKISSNEGASEDAKALSIGYSGTDNASRVTDTLVLPSKGYVYGSSIDWSSSHPRIVDEDGHVSRPSNNTSVTLTATIKNGDEIVKKNFTVIVVGTKDGIDETNKRIEEDRVALEIVFSSGNTKDSVTQNVTLPTTGAKNNSDVSWTSSNTSVITAKGAVTRPDQDTVVTLTAKLTLDGKSVTKKFNLTVKAKTTAAKAITITGTETNGNLTISVTDILDWTTIKYTGFNLYDKRNNNAIVYSKVSEGAVTEFKPSVPAGEYGAEVVYYDSDKKALYRGEQLIYYNLSLRGDSLVSSIMQGSPATLYGQVVSLNKIKTIKVSILDSNGEKLLEPVSVSPKTATYALANSALDNKIRFDLLPVGTATVKLKIEDSKGYSLSRSYKIKVLKDQRIIENTTDDEEISAPVVLNCSSEYTIERGEKLKLDGEIVSQSPFTVVSAVVANYSETKATIDFGTYPAKIYDSILSGLVLDTGKLAPGSYTIKIYAKTEYSDNKPYTLAKIPLTVEDDFWSGKADIELGGKPKAKAYRSMLLNMKNEGKLTENDIPYYYVNKVKYHVYTYECADGKILPIFVTAASEALVTDEQLLTKLMAIYNANLQAEAYAKGMVELADYYGQLNINFTTVDGVLKGCEFIGDLVGMWASAGIANIGTAAASVEEAGKLATVAANLKEGISAAGKAFTATVLPKNFNDALRITAKATLVVYNADNQLILSNHASKLLNKEYVSYEMIERMQKDINKCLEIQDVVFEYGVDLYDVPKSKIEAFFKAEKAFFSGVTGVVWKPISWGLSLFDFASDALKADVINECSGAADLLLELGEHFADPTTFKQAATNLKNVGKFSNILKGGDTLVKYIGFMKQCYLVGCTDKDVVFIPYDMHGTYLSAYSDMLNNSAE